MKRLIATALLLSLLTAGPAHAGSAAGGGAGAYLKMGIGARPLALGGAYVGLAEGPAALLYNPAGLARQATREVDTMHAMLTLDRSLDYVAYAHPLRKGKNPGTLALGYVRYGVDGIPETRVYDATNVTPGNLVGDPITVDGVKGSAVKVFGYFEDVEDTLTLGYGRPFDEKLSFGLALARHTHDLFNNSADGFGLDLGLLYKANPRATVGAALRNAGAVMEWDTASGRKDRIPVTSVVGCAYRIRPNLTALVDLEKTGEEDLRSHVGVEGQVNRRLVLRGGLDNSELSLGAGFRDGGWAFDYAFADRELGDVHRVSASRKF